MDRALPDWAIDLIRDGVPAADLAARGSRATWRALLRTASSAQARGWDRMEWEYLVLEPKSKLGFQLRLRDRNRERSSDAINKLLADAWEAAWEWRTEQPQPWTKDQVRDKASERAQATLLLIADADADLNNQERAVLQYAAQETQRRGMLRVALPWRDVRDATNLSEYATKRTLAQLRERGLLYRESRGRSGGEESGKRRAALYVLPTEEALRPYMCRDTRPMGDAAEAYGTSAKEAPGTPAQPYGRPPAGGEAGGTGELLRLLVVARLLGAPYQSPRVEVAHTWVSSEAPHDEKARVEQ